MDFLIGGRNDGGGGVTSLFSVGRKLSRSIVVISSLILVIPLDLDLDCKFCNSISSSSLLLLHQNEFYHLYYDQIY